ncbi:MAG: hypothetical protein C0596_10535 [Marinilabiliales bacterium]|nr:MAG: hypothetical protein C0596_10535 [Marinilabiliales bacterium]
MLNERNNINILPKVFIITLLLALFFNSSNAKVKADFYSVKSSISQVSKFNKSASIIVFSEIVKPSQNLREIPVNNLEVDRIKSSDNQTYIILQDCETNYIKNLPQICFINTHMIRSSLNSDDIPLIS